MPSAFFDILAPISGDSPIVVEVPHASTIVPDEWKGQIKATPRMIAGDADLYVDELFRGCIAHGATLIAAKVSRYVIDLNRAAPPRHTAGSLYGGDLRARAVAKHGLIWSLTSGGDAVSEAPPSSEEIAHRLETIYWPYHEALSGLLLEKRRRHGFALLIAAHSMPTPQHWRDGAPPDVVPGTKGRTTASKRFIEVVEQHARGEHWKLVHDNPYAGGNSTRHYGRPADDVHAIQIELARRLYLDEQTLDRNPATFRAIAAACEGLIERLALECRSGGGRR